MNEIEKIEKLERDVKALHETVFTLAGWLIQTIGENGYKQLIDIYEREKQ
jgi:hypothetical protein